MCQIPMAIHTFILNYFIFLHIYIFIYISHIYYCLHCYYYLFYRINIIYSISNNTLTHFVLILLLIFTTKIYRLFNWNKYYSAVEATLCYSTVQPHYREVQCAIVNYDIPDNRYYLRLFCSNFFYEHACSIFCGLISHIFAYNITGLIITYLHLFSFYIIFVIPLIFSLYMDFVHRMLRLSVVPHVQSLRSTCTQDNIVFVLFCYCLFQQCLLNLIKTPI